MPAARTKSIERASPIPEDSKDHFILPPILSVTAGLLNDPVLSIAANNPSVTSPVARRESMSSVTSASGSLSATLAAAAGAAGAPNAATKDAADKAKRKRQSQSCDACRSRKVKCARENPDEEPQSHCKHCIALGIPCTYNYQPKKRGPPNLYLRRLQEAAAAAQREAEANGTAIPHSANSNSPPDLSKSTINPSATLVSPIVTSALHVSAHSPTSPSTLTATSSSSQPPGSNSGASPYPIDRMLSPLNPLQPGTLLPPSRYPIAADNYHPHFPPQAVNGTTNGLGMGMNGSGRPTTAGSATGATPGSGASADGRSNGTDMAVSPSDYSATPYSPYTTNTPWSASNPYRPPPPLHHSLSHSSLSHHNLHIPPVPPPTALPPLNYFVHPHRLEDVAPRERILLIINLFFDYVYPLTPCIHKPSFMADLHSRKEEREPLFFALVMSTVASTLVQVPRSYVPMERAAVRRLARTAHEASRMISVASYDPPTSTHVVIRYFDTVYHFCEGHEATSHAAFGEAAHIAVTLSMHEESSYEGLDPIECEIRRRAFWLLFGADKSMSVLLGRPICLRDEDCTLQFPREVDDEFITPNGILPQPPGKTAIVSGLNYISRIFALLGEILVRIRVDKRSPPQGPLATLRLEEVKSLHARIMSALAHAPPPLRLKSRTGGATTAGTLPVNGATGAMLPDYGGAGFASAAFAEVKDFFDNPNASRANASNHFLVMQGNLYVTQQLVRFVIEQYRDELIETMRIAKGGDAMDIDNSPTNTAAHREAVVSDLLNVLHSIPLQSIATNGPSLVHKVRYVASTLLDAVRKAEEAPASAARAHAYLWEFLSILSEIERNYLLDDDREVGDGMTS